MDQKNSSKRNGSKKVIEEEWIKKSHRRGMDQKSHQRGLDQKTHRRGMDHKNSLRRNGSKKVI